MEDSMYGEESRISKRALALAIVVILAALALATWGGTCIGASRANQQVKETEVRLVSATTQVSQLQSKSDNLQQSNATLKTQLASAETERSQLQANYSTLQQSNATLRTQLASVQTELPQLESKYASQMQENSALRAQLQTLTSQYDTLLTRYSALEKTKEFAADSRLRVILSTEAQPAPVTWLRGQVTNIGTTTVQRVYVLVSRYKADGSLDRLDLPPTIMLNLAPQSAGYFSFLTAGENCKVTVLGDY